MLYAALAVFVRSPAAYEALKEFNIMQLPSRATLQAYTGAFIHDAGACLESIAKQVENYHIFQESCRVQGKAPPKSVGAIIFDEVKVISQLMWNSRNHRIIGLSMSSDDQSTLHDVFQLFDKDHRTKQTKYILQFLWRDITSSFDIVGPYFTNSGTVEAKFICSCVLETIKLFQVCFYTYAKFHFNSFNGLRTNILICDRASTNLSVIKASHGCHGMYGTCSGEDPHQVNPWFVNPFDPSHNIYWLVCPSHQVCDNDWPFSKFSKIKPFENFPLYGTKSL